MSRNMKYFNKISEMQDEFISSERKAFSTVSLEEKAFYLTISFFDNLEIIENQDKSFEISQVVTEPQKIGTLLINILSQVEEIDKIIYKYINIANKQEHINSSLSAELLIIIPCFEELSKLNTYFKTLKNFEIEEFKNQLKLFSKHKTEVLGFKKERFENLNKENLDSEMLEIQKDLIETNKELQNFFNNQSVMSFTIDYLKTIMLNIKELLKLINVYFNIDYTDDVYTGRSLEKKLFIFDILENPSNSFIFPRSKTEAKIKIDNEYINIWNFKGKYLYKNYSDNKQKNRELLLKYIDNNKIKIFNSYNFNNIQDLLNITFIECIKNNITIKKCKNCNKYFLTKNRTDEVYCNRTSPQNPNKTCKEYGAKKTYRDEIKSIPIKNEHNKTSQFYRMKINRAKEQKEKERYEKHFNIYKENYQKKKAQYKLNKLKEDDFVKWIINQKSY